MRKSNLDEDGMKLLEQALKMIGGDVQKISEAVNKVIEPIKGARRGYLFRELNRRIKRRCKARKSIPHFNSVTITPAMRVEARRHELQLTKDIPEDDR